MAVAASEGLKRRPLVESLGVRSFRIALALPIHAGDPFEKWEKEIEAIEDRNRGATVGGVVFVGSSSIRRWA